MVSMMKAYEIRGPGDIRFVDCPVPQIDRQSVLLQTKRVSICATDVGYYRGYLLSPEWPVIPGHEYVGEVVDTGLKDGSVKVGDKIVYWGQTDFGGLAEFRALRPILPGTRIETPWVTERGFTDDVSAAAIVLDNEVSLDEATLLEPLTAVLRASLVHPPNPGDDVVVLGAGPCGLIALQLLKKCHGAHSVTVLDKNPHRLNIASRLGANRIFNVDTQRSELEQLVIDSRGEYADYVFDTLPDITEDVDIPNTRTTAMKLLTPDCHYIIYGATEVPQPIETWLILSKGLKLQGTPFDVRVFPMWRTADVLVVAKEIMSHGMITVSPIISHLVDFYNPSSVQTAFERHGEGTRLKTLVSLEINEQHSATSSVTTHNQTSMREEGEKDVIS